MKDAAPQTVRLADYTPFSHRVEDVHLTFRLAPRGTRVRARIRFAPNPQAAPTTTLVLQGEGLRARSTTVDGAAVVPEPCPGGIAVTVPAGAFTWEAEVEIDPE